MHFLILRANLLTSGNISITLQNGGRFALTSDNASSVPRSIYILILCSQVNFETSIDSTIEGNICNVTTANSFTQDVHHTFGVGRHRISPLVQQFFKENNFSHQIRKSSNSLSCSFIQEDQKDLE